MKINDTKEVQAVSSPPARPVSSSPKAEQASSAGDRVTVERSREIEAALANARGRGGSHAARLQQLASDVKKGQYLPNANNIADRILEAAELEAQIRAMLR